ncbi:MAG: tetratricopeptide repeat protein [Myxococcales bacterium FL481]|nr:MAG: tetratricopeptide repeat protein [Myxococcales bacterium FL481]
MARSRLHLMTLLRLARPPRVLGALLLAGACGDKAVTDTPSSASAAKASPATVPKAEAPPAPPSQEELAERYRSLTGRLGAETPLSAAQLEQMRSELSEVASLAEDPHLRANASLAVGALFEESGDAKSAVAFFRQAVAAVPNEAPTHAMLALALAKSGELPQAIDVQQRVVELLPNDLEAWLHLGEMNIKAGRQDAGAKAYATYEVRRKAILDGLTLKSKGGEYLLPASERVAMAAALEVASDNGTGLALLYALKSDPDANVRAEIARVMGTQRLLGYRKLLEETLKKESDAEARKVMQWAVDEIARAGRETAPGPAPQPVVADTERPAQPADAPAKAVSPPAPPTGASATLPAAARSGSSSEDDPPAATPSSPDAPPKPSTPTRGG